EPLPTLAVPGFSLRPSTNRLAVAPRNIGRVEIRVEIEPAHVELLKDPTSPSAIGGFLGANLLEASGQVLFLDEKRVLHLPYHAVIRPVAAFHSSALEYGVPRGDSVTATIATEGPKLTERRVVYAFVLGYTNRTSGHGTLEGPGDLVAVGAASDFAAAGAIEQARVFFGVAVASNWTTPQPAFVNYQAEIDVNQDDRADFVVFNSSAGELDANSAGNRDSFNDALLSVMQRNEDDPLVVGGILNVLDAKGPDTAPHASS